MNTTMTDSQSSASYRNYMTEPHRRFHDRIVADLNGILPICNQGKCTAADISNDVTEQQQITGLMQKVELLCTHLSENVTDLFSQYYRERGRFCGTAYCTTAEIKINLVDRLLQDRSTDVRWWSKEPTLATSVNELRKTSDSLDHDFEELAAYLEGAVMSFRIPSLNSEWNSIDIADHVEEISSYFPRKRDLMFHPELRMGFAKSVEMLLEIIKSVDSQAATVKFATKLLRKLEGCQKQIDSACSQLEMIRTTYPSLFDIVVTDDRGLVIANACPKRRKAILAKNVIHESWCRDALKSSSQTQIQRAPMEGEDHPAIVFSTSILPPEDRKGSVLGSISVFCDFQSEVQSLLGKYMPTDENGRTDDGWFSFFTDDRGVVICSNDADAVWPGSQCDLPRSHRQLDNGKTCWSHSVFKGRESLVFSARANTKNSLGGSGWVSHLVAPTTDIMQTEAKSARIPLGTKQLMQSKLVPEISKTTYAALQEDRKAIKLISLNGILFASQLGSRGAALAPVFDKITATGDSATNRMESLLYEMANSEIDLNLSLQETLAKQAVDLIAQKVLERSQALRLWSRMTCFQNYLTNPKDQSETEIQHLLRMINDDYPVFRNILLTGSGGEIKACSRPSRLVDNDVRCVADQMWFNKALRSHPDLPSQVTEVHLKRLDSSAQSALVFANSVPGASANEASLGVLACFFDWQSESSEILNACLPKSATGRPLTGSVAFFANREQIVLDSTDPNSVKVSEYFPLPEEHYQLSGDKTFSGTFTYNGASYIVASAKCEHSKHMGSLEWSAHVIRPLI
jgi:hypothetical protein